METGERGEEHVAPDRGNWALAAVGYLPLMFLLPLLGAREDRFTRFHGGQSMVLFAAFMLFWVAVWVIDLVFGRMMGSIVLLGYLFRAIAWCVHNLVGAAASLGYVALMVFCMAQAATGRVWRIPVLGVYAERLGFGKL